MPPNRFESEHERLVGQARALVTHLSGLELRIDSGEVSYEQHRTYARRAAALAEQLSAGISLASNDIYGPAFCLLRPALEQVVFDRLLCLATQHLQTMADVSEETFARWNRSAKQVQIGRRA